MSTTTPEILRKAAEVVRERGLYKGSMLAPSAIDGPCCTYAALFLAAGAEQVMNEFTGSHYLYPTGISLGAIDPTRAFLEKTVGTKHLPSWNDRPERTLEEVTAALRTAADMAETLNRANST